MAAKRLAKKKNRHEPCAKRPLKMLTLSSCSHNNSGGVRAPLQVCGVSGPSRREPCVSLSHFRAGLVAAARLRSRWGSRRLADCAVRPVVACRVCPPKTELKVGFAPGGRPGPQRAHRGRPSAGAPRVSACVRECACVSVCVRGRVWGDPQTLLSPLGTRTQPICSSPRL